jgi:hypothetical protein
MMSLRNTIIGLFAEVNSGSVRDIFLPCETLTKRKNYRDCCSDELTETSVIISQRVPGHSGIISTITDTTMPGRSDESILMPQNYR